MADFNTSFGALPFDILTFLPNVDLITFSLRSLQDEITEGIECLYFTLEPVDEFVDVPYGNETVTICIVDDDRKFNYMYQYTIDSGVGGINFAIITSLYCTLH